jgi:hypothetical protein
LTSSIDEQAKLRHYIAHFFKRIEAACSPPLVPSAATAYMKPTANKRKISSCRQYPHNIKPRHDATIDNQRHILTNRSANG